METNRQKLLGVVREVQSFSSPWVDWTWTRQTRSMVGVAHAMGQIRQARLNTWIELKFWVDRIIVIVSDLDLGNPQHDAPGLDIAFSLGSPKEKDQDTLTGKWIAGVLIDIYYCLQ